MCELIGIFSDLGSIDGRSLVPLLNKQSLIEEPAYIESGSASAKKLGKVIGIRTSNYKYCFCFINHKMGLQQVEYSTGDITDILINLSSGTPTIPIFGSIVQKGKFSA